MSSALESPTQDQGAPNLWPPHPEDTEDSHQALIGLGIRKVSFSSNESSEGDDNIVLPRSVHSPRYESKPATFSPFAPEFCPSGAASDNDDAHHHHHHLSSPAARLGSDTSLSSTSSKGPPTPGLVNFDSPEAVNSPLATPEPEDAPAPALDASSYLKSSAFRFETPVSAPQYELSDDILKFHISSRDKKDVYPFFHQPWSQQQQQSLPSPSRAMSPPGPRSSSRSQLHPAARPWSPSPLRQEQRPGSTHTASTVTPGPREPFSPSHSLRPSGLSKLHAVDESSANRGHFGMQEHNRSRLAMVELGEPEDSPFPLSAFSSWKAQRTEPGGEGEHPAAVETSQSAQTSGLTSRHHQRQCSHDSATSSHGSSIEAYELSSPSTHPHHHSARPSASRPSSSLLGPSPSDPPLSFAQRQQQRQSAVLAASMASARRSSGSSQGSAAFDTINSADALSHTRVRSQKVRATPPPPISTAARHSPFPPFDQPTAILPGAGLPGAGLPPAPSPANFPAYPGSPSPSLGNNPATTLYHLSQLGFDAQTSDAILHLASTQPNVFNQLVGNSVPASAGGAGSSSAGGPSPHNRKYGLYKTELCRSWEEKGSCRYGVRASFLPTSLVNLIHMSQVKCQFAHGPDELRVINRHPKYKTQVCRAHWVTGSCPFGRRCCFLHNVVPSGKNPLSPVEHSDSRQERPAYSMSESKRDNVPSLAHSMSDPYYPHHPSSAGDPYSSDGSQSYSSFSHSRSSSFNSQPSGRPPFEINEADRRLFDAAAARQHQNRYMPGSTPNTPDMSVYDRATFGDQKSNLLQTQGLSVGQGSADTRSPSAQSPFTPLSANSFASPQSATSSAISPFTPLSSLLPDSASDPWSTSNSPFSPNKPPTSRQEEDWPSSQSYQVYQDRGLQPKAAPKHQQASFGAIGAPRNQQTPTSHDPATGSTASHNHSSALAEHAKFLSQLAVGHEEQSMIASAPGPQSAY